MKPFLAVLLAVITSAAVLPAAVLAPPTPRDFDAILAEGFPAAAARLDALVRENYKPGTGSIPSNVNQPAFRSWLALGDWCRALSSENLTVDPIFAREAMANLTFVQDFAQNLSPKDNPSAALKILQDLWRADPAKFWQYSRLALAIALVYDQPVPEGWPHHQVSADALPGPAMTPPQAFAFWVDSAKAGKLYNDPKTLPVDQLKYLVDVFLPADELRWAQKNARFPRGDFGKAFSSITYDHPRLLAGAYVWPRPSYTLAEIKKLGGICVDQAYFAAVAGKANGLPTLYFSGQGDDGGHAWFGYLKGANRWELDCGRYENQNYAVGEAFDPQTGEPINDSELEFLAKPSQRTAGFQQSQADLAMAHRFLQSQQPDKALIAMNCAIAASPDNVTAWKEKTALIPIPADRKTHFEKALNQFPANPEIRAYFQKEMAEWYRQSGDPAKATEWEQKVISQNRNGRSDLSVTAAAAGLASLVKAKQMDEAMKEYRSLLNRLGRNGGGNFFYEIVAPFTEVLLASGDPKSAKRALELARRALQPETGSILDQELRGLEARTN